MFLLYWLGLCVMFSALRMFSSLSGLSFQIDSVCSLASHVVLTFLFMCMPWSYSPFRSDLTWTARWSPTVLSKCFCFFTRILFRYLRPNYFLSDKAATLILVNFSLRTLWLVKPSLSPLISYFSLAKWPYIPGAVYVLFLLCRWPMTGCPYVSPCCHSNKSFTWTLENGRVNLPMFFSFSKVFCF